MNHVTDHVLNFSLIIKIPKLNLSTCTLLILWILFKNLTLKKIYLTHFFPDFDQFILLALSES